jgi:sec-independent protein translocase protein TatA
MPGMGELLIILLIVLLIFGAGKLPQIGEALGRSIKNFKRSTTGDDEIEVSKSKQIEKSTKGELEDGSGDADIAEADVVVEKAKVEKAKA